MKFFYVLFMLFIFGSMTQLSYAQSEQDSTKSEYEFFEISEQPKFPGGAEEMMKFISNEVIYPKDAIDNGIEGTVTIQFVVDKDGSLTDIKVLRDPGGGLGDEGKRIVELMPKWSPGYQKNEPVRVKMIIPLRFKLNNESKVPEIPK